MQPAIAQNLKLGLDACINSPYTNNAGIRLLKHVLR